MHKTHSNSGDFGGHWPRDPELGPGVRSAQRREPGAVEALLADLRPRFFKFFARKVDRDTADDLAQDALLRVLGSLPRLNPDRAARYVMRLAHYRRRSAWRVGARDLQRYVPLEAALHVASPVTAGQDLEYDDLIRATETLSPKLRACMLGVLRGLRPEEIAAALGVSPVNVRARLKLARKAIRAALSMSEARPRVPQAPNPHATRRVREAATCLPYLLHVCPNGGVEEVEGVVARLCRVSRSHRGSRAAPNGAAA
jgi:RNA polymerase sigma factor (sigma-70 family)